MAEKVPVQKVIPATEVRNKLGQLLNRVFRGEEQLVVEKLGIPVAAIISMRDYERYQQLVAAARLTNLVRVVGADAERQGLNDEQLQRELRQTREDLFKETYARTTS